MLLHAVKGADPAAPGAPEGPAQNRPADRLDWPRPGFSAWTRRITWAAAEAILADEDAAGEVIAASPAACERAVSALDLAVGRSSRELRRGFAVLGAALEWLPLFIIGAWSRMSRLPIARRVQYLEALEGHRVGLFSMLLIAFKVPLCIPAFEDGEEFALTGLDRADTVARRKLPLAPRELPRTPPPEARP